MQKQSVIYVATREEAFGVHHGLPPQHEITSEAQESNEIEKKSRKKVL